MAHDPESLIARAKEGDEKAFEALMLEHETRVYRTALALLGNREDAKDATQDVFIRFFRHLRRLDAHRDPAPWLYRIAVNVCRDVGRKRTRLRWLRLEQRRRTEDASAPAVDRLAEANEARRIILDGLKELPERERTALVLRDVDGHSTEAVARILGVSSGTVRSQVSRARVKLKRYRDRVLGEKG